MKAKFLIGLMLIVTITSVIFPAENPNKSKSSTYNKYLIVENLLVGINSDNEGLKSSSAYFLGELKSKEAVIPLLGILKGEENEELRIMAALSLTKIGDARGIYAVKQAIKFDKSERVRKVCSGFYQDYLSKS
jgi:hypothetical protein